jgi:crotonobetainyl-CoA:carnitine CoA-transferase CaiB-like acyl-CoA transferase
MVEQADVLVQNYRPRVASKLGIDFETLSAINPRLVYGSINGYGEDGPLKDRPGQDLLLQCFTGLTMNGGRADGLPQASPLYMVDVTASHMVCEGVLAALVARSVTSKGQEVKVTMMGAIMEMQCQEITSYIAADAPPVRGSSPQVSIYQEPPYGIYDCSEGFFAIAQANLDVLSDALALPELAEMKIARPKQSDGVAVANWRDTIYEIIAGRLNENSAKYWDSLLSPLGVWCMVVNDYDAFLNHPQTQNRLVEIEHPVGGKYTAVKSGIQFSQYHSPVISAAPAYGADSEKVLCSFGFTKDEFSKLVQSGAVYYADKEL